MSDWPFPTKYEVPLRQLNAAALAVRLERAAKFDDHLLLLPERQRVAAVVGLVRSAGEGAGRRVITVEAPGRPAEALEGIGRALLASYDLDWDDYRRDYDGELYMDTLAILMRGLAKTPPESRRQGPLLVVSGLEPESACVIFARGRDEAWGFNVQIIVVAPREDKDSYLLTVSDSFFLNQHFAV